MDLSPRFRYMPSRASKAKGKKKLLKAKTGITLEQIKAALEDPNG